MQIILTKHGDSPNDIVLLNWKPIFLTCPNKEPLGLKSERPLSKWLLVIRGTKSCLFYGTDVTILLYSQLRILKSQLTDKH